MKPLNIAFAALLFSALVISGGGFYGGMVADYTSIGATEKIDTAGIGEQEILDDTLEISEDMDSGIRAGVESIPFIGGILVQVFSIWQTLKSFIINLWTALSIGADLLNNLRDLIPYTIPPQIMTIIQASLVFMFVGAIVYLLIGRKVD